MKTLKSKISFVYLFLVVISAIIGFTSAVNSYTLSKSINGLMVDNYKSINSINNMLQEVDDQNFAILAYIYVDKQKGINSFHKHSDAFYKWYSIEENNITENGEKEYVQKIKRDYIKYSTLFSEIGEVQNTKGLNEALNFYNSSITPTFIQLKTDLKDLSLINEKAMFNSKDIVTKDADQSLYIILVLSSIGVLGGFVISRISVKKAMKPIYSLQETIKSVKAGYLTQQSPILSDDEIGELTKEFNKMTQRLQKYEQSTLGRLMIEKTKSIAIVKSISDPLIVLDTHYKITLLNNACEHFFDIQEDNVINKYFLEVIRNGDLYDYIVDSFSNSDMIREPKIVCFNSDSKDYYFNVIVTLVKDPNDKTSGIVILFQNVTQLKQVEKLKTDFISTISHEFKTPLTSIMIGTTLITDEKIGALNEKQRKIINAIQEDGERLSELVTGLLQLSKIESNKSIFNIESCSIIGIIENSIRKFDTLAKEKQINLYYEADEDLTKVKVDSEKITWALNNLISNALKYTNAGDEIVLNAFIKHKKMCVSVKDTGVGIPEEFLSKIFEKFVQVERPDIEMISSGLGLAIAKEIVEAQGGEIWCESKLDVGSAFTFTLRLDK